MHPGIPLVHPNDRVSHVSATHPNTIYDNVIARNETNGQQLPIDTWNEFLNVVTPSNQAAISHRLHSPRRSAPSGSSTMSILMHQ